MGHRSIAAEGYQYRPSEGLRLDWEMPALRLAATGDADGSAWTRQLHSRPVLSPAFRDIAETKWSPAATLLFTLGACSVFWATVARALIG